MAQNWIVTATGDKEIAKRNKIIGIALTLVSIFPFLMFFNLVMDGWGVYLALKFRWWALLVFFILMGYGVLMVGKSKRIRNVQVQVSETMVGGNSFKEPTTMQLIFGGMDGIGTRFDIPIRDIIAVELSGSALTIRTQNTAYNCLEIEHAAEVREAIMERMHYD